MGKMSYIIVTYNGENHIKRCIDDIRNFDKEGFVLLIDNASSDNTIKEAKKSQPSKIIELSENLGFGKANNIGLKYLYNKGFDHYFLVNQDLYFTSGNYKNFIGIVEKCLNRDYAIISPLHLAPDTKDFDFKFKSYISAKNTPSLLSDLENDNFKEIYESKVVNAAAWILSRKTIEKIGYFDPFFDHYGEDTDYIKRIKYWNLKIGISPLFKAIHNRPQSESHVPQKIKKSTKIWALSYLKDINHSFLDKLTKFPVYLYHRIKRNDDKWNLYFSILFNVFANLPLIIKSRKRSKQKMAFANVITYYEQNS